MNNQRQFWNEKFSKEGLMYGEHPNRYIAVNAKLLAPDATILCLAEGEGRNAIYLAQQGFTVEALDASDIGLAKLQKRAEAAGLAIQSHHTDLNHWKPQKQYDAIVASFMHLPEPLRTKTLHRAIEALHPGGYLIMEFFSKNQLLQSYQSGGPKEESLLYDVTELQTIITNQAVTVIELCECEDWLDEGWGHQGKASLIRLTLQKKH